MTPEELQRFDCWCVVDVMGHNRYAGRVTEQQIGGASFIRVDVPELPDRAAFTKLLSPGSIFCITPTTEQVARHAAARFRAEALGIVDFPTPQRQLPHRDYTDRDSYDDRDTYDDG